MEGNQQTNESNCVFYEQFHASTGWFKLGECYLVATYLNWPFYNVPTKLAGTARGKRQPLQEMMTPCTTLSSVGRARPTAMTTSTYKGTYVDV